MFALAPCGITAECGRLTEEQNAMCARMTALPHSYLTVRCAVEHRYGTEELFVDGDVIGSTFCDNSFAGVRFCVRVFKLLSVHARIPLSRLCWWLRLF